MINLYFNKEQIKLRFQKQWKEFSWEDILNKLKDYWHIYRYMDEIEKYVEFENRKILDVGCGVISVLNIIPGERYRIDPLMDRHKKLYILNKNISRKRAYGEAIPSDNSFFDVGFCSNVLDHTDNPTKCISEIGRVLTNKGKLVLTVDIFEKRRERDKVHPSYSLDIGDILNLLQGDFEILFKKMSPINAQVYNFMKEKVTKMQYKECIIIAEKKVE